MTFWAKDEVRHFGASQGEKGYSQDDEKSKCLVIWSLSCTIDMSWNVISGNNS